MIGELIEKLCIANIKLFKVCDDKAAIVDNPANFSKADVVAILKKDLLLCTSRAQLKNAIDTALSQSIMQGELSVVDEVKQYG